ncbi:MAG: tol-pal system protein YbgF [Deltaproteobacteria bacterium]|nr:tol-pal system protein YbgF [Deltaproteobacteria bacterium]
MMRDRAVVLSMFFFCLGCASGNKVQLLEADIADLREIQARQIASIGELKSEVRLMKGMVEELAHVSSNKTKELEQTIKRFGTRVPPPQGVPAQLLAEDEEQIASVAGGQADAFKKALALLRTGDYEAARSSFQSFVEANPDTTYSDNALFWVGICQENLGQYDRAIVSYSDVFQIYPAENRVPEALFRLGESFAKINSVDEAILTMQKLVEEHPKSAVASKAKQRIQELRRRQRS